MGMSEGANRPAELVRRIGGEVNAASLLDLRCAEGVNGDGHVASCRLGVSGSEKDSSPANVVFWATGDLTSGAREFSQDSTTCTSTALS